MIHVLPTRSIREGSLHPMNRFTREENLPHHHLSIPEDLLLQDHHLVTELIQDHQVIHIQDLPHHSHLPTEAIQLLTEATPLPLIQEAAVTGLTPGVLRIADVLLLLTEAGHHTAVVHHTTVVHQVVVEDPHIPADHHPQVEVQDHRRPEVLHQEAEEIK